MPSTWRKSLYSFYELLHYKAVIFRNKAARVIHTPDDPVFLFILCPPFSGSTLLSELLSTSANVSTNNTLGTREGQQLPEVKALMWKVKNKYDPSVSLDWEKIKAHWLNYWNVTRAVLLEKSPPNIAHAAAIQDHFQPVRFIALTRDPYALCESAIHRALPGTAVEPIAEFVIHCLWLQKQNLETLDNILQIPYEELADHPLEVKEKLIHFLPALSDINISGIFKGHNFDGTRRRIQNLNAENISRLTVNELRTINRVFRQNKDILEYFNYRILPG
jgi:hypothetical protein